MGVPPTPPVSQAPPANDQANAVVQGQFPGGAGVSASFMPWGPFNLVLYGVAGTPNGAWTGSVQLERSFDGGVTWVICGIGGGGQQAVWTTGGDVSVVVGEPERGVMYRLRATALTVGVVNYRMSMTGGAALSLAVASSI